MPKNCELGMDRKITRRDFIEGASIAVAGSLLPGTGLAAPATKPPSAAGNYPPGRGGLRGSHDGSFEVAHQLAREGRSDWGPVEDSDGIVYDLVVVGAGISGAIYFDRKPMEWIELCEPTSWTGTPGFPWSRRKRRWKTRFPKCQSYEWLPSATCSGPAMTAVVRL
jgi:hypothetical protein